MVLFLFFGKLRVIRCGNNAEGLLEALLEVVHGLIWGLVEKEAEAMDVVFKVDIDGFTALILCEEGQLLLPIIEEFRAQILLYKRFLDDIFMIWSGSSAA